eukprot:CAMPEP_0116555480 /NCGR_PEP_ID=MMETSP0397-20121206/8171_1 /TAXON_ID=216820 /ORGANISM="Cyclophora tenuis, Strain ECT3854" /LENGTH=377 /DNA_ID=CAMNT_0004080757 /DNA_START=86 /DNA_END=1219 /DNA_ORIENTATION=-
MPIYGAPMKSVKADSKMGQNLLSKARKLEQNDEVDFTWVSGYSLKFQGCHHVSQWNEEADGEDDVRIQTKRLVRFRLCPSDYCAVEDAGGCNSGYGDYIIDMNVYLDAYIESVNDYNEYRCEYLQNNVCDCEDDDGKGDDFDRDICEYDCYVANGVEDICADNNPYNDDEEEEEKFELEEYMECARWEAPDNNNRRRRRRKLEEDEVEYFLGPYCAEQGGAIFLGLFTDETCTTFADDYGGTELYQTLAGEELPYGASSIIGMDCMTCMEPQDADENNDGNDNVDEDQVKEVCEQIYSQAGKCESNLGIDDPNENACTYMEGIKIVRQDGIVQTQASQANKTASIFIGIFVVAFVLLAAYVYYLRTKLDRASINLSE